jgi:hypothetical protein
MKPAKLVVMTPKNLKVISNSSNLGCFFMSCFFQKIVPWQNDR